MWDITGVLVLGMATLELGEVQPMCGRVERIRPTGWLWQEEEGVVDTVAVAFAAVVPEEG
jgi:hypothetical protein